METNEIILKPEDHGFKWSLEAVHVGQGSNKVQQGKPDTPVLVVTDVAKFEASFPGHITAWLNGSSPRVVCQGINRRERERNSGVTTATLQARIVAYLQHSKPSATVVTEKVYVLPDDTTTKDKAEFLAAWGITE